VRIWIDECLSPSLTVTARDRGYESTCNLHRDMLGATDAELFATAPREDWTSSSLSVAVGIYPYFPPAGAL
jgi:predicted nuclease of predicted toxin-antitoxin system